MNVSVSARLDAFEPKVRTFLPTIGKTLRELVLEAGFDGDVFDECGVIRINGHDVAREVWARVRPHRSRSGLPVVVTMHLVPAKGDTFRIVASLAVLAAATAVTGGLAAPVLGSAFAVGTVGAAVAGAAIGIVGSLALNALAGPPLAPKLGVGTQSKEIAGISRNDPAPLEPLPVVLGRMRVSPPPLAPPYTTLEDGEVYANAIYGLFGAYEISLILLNGTDIDEFEDVTYSTRQGLDSDSAPSQAFDESVWEEQPNLKMSEYEQVPGSNDLVDQATPENSYNVFHYFHAKAPGDDGKIVIRFFWPTGLAHIDRAQDPQIAGVPVRIEIKPTTSAVWYKLPDCFFQGFSKHTAEVRQTIKIQWVSSLNTTELTPATTNFAWFAYWTYATGGANERQAEAVYNGNNDPYAQGVTREVDGFIIEVLDSELDGDLEYDIRIRIGVPFGKAQYTPATFLYGGDLAEGSSLFHHYTSGGVDQLVSDPNSPAASVYIESVASYYTESAFDYEGLASIAIKAKGLQVDSLSAIFTSIVPVWNGANWMTEAASQNPAALFRHINLGPGNAKPVPGDSLDEESIEDWYDRCAADGLECNAVVQGLSMPLLRQLIASAGWASPRYSDLLGVVMERDRSAEPVTQLFTPLNSRDLGTIKDFPLLPHAIRAEYLAEDNDWQLADDVTVYAPGYDVSTATIIEAIRYEGITDTEKVRQRAQLDMDQLHQRAVRYVREVAQEGFISTRGSLVGLADDVLVRAHRYALLRSILSSGGTITGFTLEAAVDLSEGYNDPFGHPGAFGMADPFNPQNRMGIAIRKADGTVATHAITESTLTHEVTLLTPVADTGQYERGQLAAVGVHGFEFRRCVVMAVEPGSDQTFIVTMADEAPEMHARRINTGWMIPLEPASRRRGRQPQRDGIIARIGV